MAKRLSLVARGFTRRQDLDFSDDGSYFVGYDYKGLPITYCKYNGDYYLSVRVLDTISARYHIQFFERYGYVRVNEDRYDLKKMREAIAND